jgi:hypothetical protein
MTCAITPSSSLVPELERVARDAGVPVHATALAVTPSTGDGFVATARLDVDDEHGIVVVRAHVAGTTAAEAVDHALARLRDQLAAAAKEPIAAGRATRPHWTFGSMPAHRPTYASKPVLERSLARTKVYAPAALAPEQAVRVAALRDVDFHLFVHVRDGRPAVVRRGDANDWAVVEPTACGTDTAMEMLDVSHARFVCFLAESPASGLHAVYRRFDGDYARLSPA